MAQIFQTFFYQPILNLLIFFYNHVPGHDLGLAIILLTIVIKLVLYPLSRQSIKSQKALQDLQPKLNEIKEKHKGDREALGKATLALYRDNKINPFSSCLPLLVQIPFFFAVFRVFRNELNNHSLDLLYPFLTKPDTLNTFFFGVLDLSQPSKILAILAGLAQFWQTKMLMAKKPSIKAPEAKDENMAAIMNKQMLYFMPALTVFFGFTFPGGLALYWLVTTLLTVAQQKIVFQGAKNHSPESEKKVIEGEVVK